MKKIGVIIQARLGSTRLPSKVLLPLGEKTIIEHIYDRCSILNIPIVVATTTNSNDDPLVDLLESKRILYYRGSENDVLNRFIGAASTFGLTHIVRVCSDNPFLDVAYLKELVSAFEKKQNVDYVSYQFNNKPTILSHFGVFAEIVSLDALCRIYSQFELMPGYKEHVTIGVYSNPEIFKIELLPLLEDYSMFDNIRLTVDTPGDYEIAKNIMVNIELKDARLMELCTYLSEQEPLLIEMKKSITLNIK
ncbi:MAG TPA: hypothetical protein PK191_05815 [Niabella sp.]|nr:hypothetical protein [Niabella sp.]HOZ96324.1 hypothetical protein [Niabella sp.]HQW14600.1 hypothetical protein [Niabella sp.]HQX19741.1 hypothetical protein [Niabella sp.]HQX41684.1 hypothetical protein [Niabella sp.]